MLCHLFILAWFTVTFSEPLTSFSSVGTQIRETRNQAVAYSEDSSYPECIFQLGGDQYAAGGQYNVYCFNITTNTMIQWDTLSYPATGNRNRNAAMVGDDIYFEYAGTYYIYNVVSKTQDFALIPFSMNTPCIVKSRTNNEEIYFVDVTGDSFGILNVVTGDTFVGPSVPTYRNILGSCDINTANGNYLYVMGGGTTNIDRIDLDNILNYSGNMNSSWETLDVHMSMEDGASIDYSGYSHAMIESIGDYVYLISGIVDGSNDGINDINYLNTKTLTVGFSGDFPYYVYYSASVYVTIYVCSFFLYSKFFFFTHDT